MIGFPGDHCYAHSTHRDIRQDRQYTCSITLLYFFEFRTTHRNPKTERDKTGCSLTQKGSSHPTLLQQAVSLCTVVGAKPRLHLLYSDPSIQARSRKKTLKFKVRACNFNKVFNTPQLQTLGKELRWQNATYPAICTCKGLTAGSCSCR